MGLIAQDVLLIEELAHTVSQSKDSEDRHYLKYDESFVYGLSAIKDLDSIVSKLQQIVQTQSMLISSLESKVQSLEARLEVRPYCPQSI